VPYEKREVEYGSVNEESITYCREDVHATQLLYEQVLNEYARHPIALQATQAFSPASIGKAYLQGMGIRPRLELQPRFSRKQLGIGMSAFYGGRTECKIRHVLVPVVYTDLLSAYTTVNSLMNLWPLVIAQRVVLKSATREIRQLVAKIELKDCLVPPRWLDFAALVQIQPQGDVLPVRGRYEKTSYNIGSNPLWCDEPLWYPLPDVIASKLITGKTPKILQALKLEPVGVQPGLRPIKLRGEVEIDPRENLFKTVIEQRHARSDKNDDTGQFLKTLANAASYGIYAEMIRTESEKQTERVLVCDGTGEPYEANERNPERPGRYFFSPMAAVITAGNRLLLAITERLVTDAGGTWAMCDTDSMAIVATEHGGTIQYTDHTGTDRTIPALTWKKVEEIRDRMKSLNPYGGKAGAASILELENENFTDKTRAERRQLYCYATSSKRYCLYNLDQHGHPQMRLATEPDRHPEEEARAATVRKRSDHGLGYLINPTNPDANDRDWILEGWQWILHDALGLPAPEPSWFDRPALMRAAVTTPNLLRNFRDWNDGKPKSEQIRPFTFMMVAAQRPHNPADDPDLVRLPIKTGPLIAPYEKNPNAWDQMACSQLHHPATRHRMTTRTLGPADDPDLITVRSLRDVFHDYRDTPEAKALGPDGKPCTTRTIGFLQRRPVTAGPIRNIGKEMNELEERIAGLRTRQHEYQNEYRRPEQNTFDQLVRPALRALPAPVGQIAGAVGLHRATVSDAINGRNIGPKAKKKLTRYAIKNTHATLPRNRTLTTPQNPSDETILTAYLRHNRSRPCVCGCGRPATGPGKYHSGSCRQAAYRARR